MKIKTCPFCGGEANVSERYDEYWSVRCMVCEAKSKFFMTKKSAIEAWNRREPMDKIVEQLGKHSFEWDNAIDYIETLVAMDIVKKGGQ